MSQGWPRIESGAVPRTQLDECLLLINSYGCCHDDALTFKKFLFLYFCLYWVFVAAPFGLSLVVSSGGSSLLALLGLLVAVASLVAEHRL